MKVEGFYPLLESGNVEVIRSFAARFAASSVYPGLVCMSFMHLVGVKLNLVGAWNKTVLMDLEFFSKIYV